MIGFDTEKRFPFTYLNDIFCQLTRVPNGVSLAAKVVDHFTNGAFGAFKAILQIPG